MRAVGAWVAGIVTFLGILGAFSALSTTPNVSKTIDNSVKALTNLFNGAFFS